VLDLFLDIVGNVPAFVRGACDFFIRAAKENRHKTPIETRQNRPKIVSTTL